jgi:hypothetical protein
LGYYRDTLCGVPYFDLPGYQDPEDEATSKAQRRRLQQQQQDDEHTKKKKKKKKKRILKAIRPGQGALLAAYDDDDSDDGDYDDSQGDDDSGGDENEDDGNSPTSRKDSRRFNPDGTPKPYYQQTPDHISRKLSSVLSPSSEQQLSGSNGGVDSRGRVKSTKPGSGTTEVVEFNLTSPVKNQKFSSSNRADQVGTKYLEQCSVSSD